MNKIAEKAPKLNTGQIRKRYVPVLKHSQRKEQPDTRTLSIRIPTDYHNIIRRLDLQEKDKLKLHIIQFLDRYKKASAE